MGKFRKMTRCMVKTVSSASHQKRWILMRLVGTDALDGILNVKTMDVKRRGITLGVKVVERREGFKGWKKRVIKIP